MNTSDLTTSHQRELLRSLRALIAERAREEVSLKQEHQQRDETARQAIEQDRDALTSAYRQEVEKLRVEYTEAMDGVMQHHEARHLATNQDVEKSVARIKRESEAAVKAARREKLLATQRATEQYDTTITAPRNQLVEYRQLGEQYRAELVTLDGHARGILSRRRCGGLARSVDAPPDMSDEAKPMDRYAVAIATARRLLQELSGQKTAKFLEEGWPFLLLLFFWGAAIYPSGLALGWSGWGWIVASGLTGAGLTLLATLIVYPIVRRQTASRYPAFEAARREADAAITRGLILVERESKQEQARITDRRDTDLHDAEATWDRVSKQIANDHKHRIEAEDEDYEARKHSLHRTRDRDLQLLNDKYPPRIDRREQLYQQEMQHREQQYTDQLAASRQEFEIAWSALVRRWSGGVSRFEQAVDQMNAYCDEHFPAWDACDWNSWQPPATPVEALRFGKYRFDLAAVEGGIPSDEDLLPARTAFDLPALLSFPERPSILLHGADQGRSVAVRTLQDLMLRLLTSMPSGKVRFTIIDSTGLGQNFSAFMHLADYDDKLVTNRIWTESAHINKRLLDLTEHMEKVIQKYLRNEFESIQKYNEHAGEVAEPFQILVVANFPAGFSDEAARRLISIAGSGPRCGVYTLISTDSKLDLPRNFDMADLEAKAATLQWRDDAFCWTDAELESLPLALEQPPADAEFTTAVKAAGKFAKDASRVEVPFASVVPAADQWWTGDSRSEVVVPLGRAGATKFQTMRLGHGTSQHVLISGKTGSGKSTLLHALITNLAIHYSPDEVEFYLIDFKKGVEFRPYAAFSLPHARVIAIESEREFGLSVLERLDEELKRRGDMFRGLGVQNLAGYRDAQPDQVLPRVLLVIDEFQELFVKDDRLAQDASLLLDRLVRQGRAFGIHVLLGSQTLAGAYSLARSTIGQMAVRIALQCSESDAHLILSEDNTAARLLSRPGEAIYNDANGLLEGNHPFQVVWLSDAEREYYLRELAVKAKSLTRDLPKPIVFEGNVAADPQANRELQQLLDSSPDERATPQAWLGAAVAIKEPTSVVFRRHSGSNLLIVGQQEEMALGVLATSLISLAAGMPTDDSASFFLLDGTHPDASTVDFWQRLSDLLPLGLQPTMPRRTSEVVERVAAELERRSQADLDSEPPLYLVVHNLGRFRDLKKSDDDFGFSMDDDATVSPGKQFTSILRDGPAFGIHTLIWCDTYNNVNRWIDRQTLRDIEMRVLFQMGATDSSNLMDSPEASRLGIHRAIIYSEELGQWEKFRPYGPPDETWLAWVRRCLETRWLQTPTA